MSVGAAESARIGEMAQAAMRGNAIDRAEALYLLEVEGAGRYDLFYWANRIRLAYFGERISLCAIAAVKTAGCPEDCRFCGQSSFYESPAVPSSASDEDLLAGARAAAAAGAACFGLVSSGRGPTDSAIERLGRVIRRIKEEVRLECCASLGCLTLSQAQRLRELGVGRYNHNLETSPGFFGQVVTTHKYADRVATVRAVQQAGMQSCCGGIIGLGESPADRVDLALGLRDLDVDVVPVNFLHPIAGTPLAGNEMIAPLVALQTVAMFRFVLPDKHIKVAGGREACLRDLQSWMFFAGADGCIIGNYLTTRGRDARQDEQMLADLGLTLVSRRVMSWESSSCADVKLMAKS